MNRRAATAFGAAALVVAGLAATRAARGGDVVLHTVERGVLRNEILATGIVDAVRKTPISVPQDLSNAMRVSWLRAAGPVSAGDVVLSFDPADMEKDALDSRSDSASASSKLDKARAEGTSKERGLDLDFTVTTDELSRARGQLGGASALALEDSDTRMTRLGRSELTFGEFSDLDETLRRIAAVSADDVRALAAELVDRPLSVAAVGPLADTAFDGLVSAGSTTGTEVA